MHDPSDRINVADSVFTNTNLAHLGAMASLCPGLTVAEAWLAPNFCVSELPVSIERPRGILSTGISSLLVLERGTASVVKLTESSGTVGIADTKTVLVDGGALGLNHGLEVHGGYLYASSSNEVYRWPYDSSSQTVLSQEAQLLITNINDNGRGGSGGGHVTRTLIFDDQDRLYVSVGSIANIDPDSFRSRIRRFSLDDESSFPIDFTTGEVFMDGLRNEVGLAFDKFGILWGVENGPDRLDRDDLGDVIYNDNPGEELHRFLEEDLGKHFGYPYCWEEFDLYGNGLGAGTAWAWPSYLQSGVVSDATCRSDYLSAELSMQAHSAPLGLTFYNWKDPSELPEECVGAGTFPQDFDGYAFIAFHGSWNREIPTGNKVVYVAMDDTGRVVGTAQDLLMHIPPNARWSDGFRPVDVDFDDCGRLLVSSDGTRGAGAKVVRIESSAIAPSPGTPAPAARPLSVFETRAPQGEAAPAPDSLSMAPSVLPSDFQAVPVVSENSETTDLEEERSTSGARSILSARMLSLSVVISALWGCISFLFE